MAEGDTWNVPEALSFTRPDGSGVVIRLAAG